MKANSGIPLDQWSGSGATKALYDSIVAFNETTTKQTRTLLRLTWVIAGLTVVMTAGVILQIYLAARQLGILH